MDAKPIRTEMIQSYIAQLRASLGEAPPVPDQLRELFGRQDYTGMVRSIRDSMSLNMRVRVGLGQRFHDLNHIRLPRRACMTKCG
jgi:hypothetical protein